MLPQIMPLPWAVMFFLIFFSLLSLWAYNTYFPFSWGVPSKPMKKASLSIIW